MASPEFILSKKIGSGSFGDVFSGTIKSTGEKIAIKRVKKKILYQYGDYLINAFWKESDCMKKCECENSVKLISNFETANNFNIIMELCDGDLLVYLNKKLEPFSVEEIKETFLQLNNVFKIMNKNNIIHRDLKLGNILIKYIDESKKKFIPKLSDYGFSKDLNEHAYTGTHLGTPATMAPEIMMNLKYNDKSDLWSIGIMIYQLHFKDLPYKGINEQQILNKIKFNIPIKQPDDPQLRDLLNKLLVMDPQKRISWDDYFNHPFFKGNNNDLQNKQQIGRYIKISDCNLGFDYNHNLFQSYIAKDTKNNNNLVLIKSYNDELININNQFFLEEFSLFKAFAGNPNVLKLINYHKENKRTILVFEYIKFEMLYNYSKKKEFTEKEIKKINQILYNIFIYNELNCLPFIFISMHSFCMNEKGEPIIFDFGFHKLLLSKEEIASYYLTNESEIINFTKNRIKTNVMNYGIVLLKLYCGDNLSIKDKEVILPQKKILSNIFNSFISKCLYRNINKRYSWLQLGDEDFLLDNNAQMSNIIGNDVLLDNDKLEIILDSLDAKFEFIIKYYDKLNIKKNMEYIHQIESFLFITLFEMKLIFQFFNRNIFKKPFTNQQEISFISINENCEINKFNLNMVNPLLKDTKIIDMNNNKLIEKFITKLNKSIKKLEKISSKIHSGSKNSIINDNLTEFLKNLVQNFENSKIQEYFFNVIKNAENEKKSDLYKELCLGEYLCEFILFVKTNLYDNVEEIHFNKQALIKLFFDIFGEDKNKIEISVIKLDKPKKNYVLVSFLGILFKNYKNKDIIDREKLEKNKQSIDGLVRYYPTLMNRIVQLKEGK